MVGNTHGKLFCVTTWGESHGDSLGCVIDGCPAGLEISENDLRAELDRDVPFPELSKRFEENKVRILSGVYEGRTLGTPISLLINNTDVISKNYSRDRNIPRPGHADLSYRMKYGHVDWRGGSRASGRTWISVVAAGGISRKICGLKGIRIHSKIVQIAGMDINNEDDLRSQIIRIAEENQRTGDSSGGRIEVVIEDLPTGLGAPAFNRFQADIGHAILNIPGVRSFEMGRGEDLSSMKGSGSNDGFEVRNGRIVSKSGLNSGVQGGITDGSSMVFRFSVKPTPSILMEQDSVDLSTMEDTKLRTEGRFDANFTPRVLVIAEALSSLVTVDHLMISGYVQHDSMIDRDQRLGSGIEDRH